MSMLIESASTIGEMASKKYRCCDCVAARMACESLSEVNGPVAMMQRQSVGISAISS